MKNLLFTILVIISVQLVAQEISIKGIVSDDFGPLPGVDIIIKGTTIGTQTDFDGNYEITAKIRDTLVFSFIGFQKKEIIIAKKSDVYVELAIDVNLEISSFCCCFPSSSITPSYNHGLKYNHKGLSLEIKNLYKLGLNLGFKLGYQSNFENDNIFQLESTVNNLFYIGSSYSTTFKFRNLNIEELDYNLKDYQLILDANYRTIFNRYTNFYFGLGITNLNKEKNVGVQGGFEQYLFSNLSIYSKTTYWSKYWEFKNAIKFNFKRIEIFAEHHKIGYYYDYNIGLGYKFYF